jgi:hypothetical protein
MGHKQYRKKEDEMDGACSSQGEREIYAYVQYF